MAEKFKKKKKDRKVACQAICTQRRCTRANNVVSVARDTRNVGLRKTFLSRFRGYRGYRSERQTVTNFGPAIRIVNLFVSLKLLERKLNRYLCRFSMNRK